MDKVFITKADLSNEVHAGDVVQMLSIYACDIMGGGEDISAFVKDNLVNELKKRPSSVLLLAYEQANPIGLVIALEGFSTFYAKPLLNIHDFVVAEQARGRGVAKLLLDECERIAKARGYCKMTLEVLEGNSRAQKVYKAFGFKAYQLDAASGNAMFWHKALL